MPNNNNTTVPPDIAAVLRCEPRPAPAPVPFIPAIYEHKAFFIKQTPAAVARDAALLARALLAEYETLAPAALTVGIDVYNIEAEAAGCPVDYGAGAGVPALAGHILREGDDLSRAPVPDPLRDGRMPLNIKAACEARRVLGAGVWLRGAVSGPFSLAISLAGADTIFMACVENPDWVRAVLDYARKIIQAYAAAFIDAGAGVVIFDSQASPDLISPAMYEKFVLPPTRDLIQSLRARGAGDVPLVIGGDTARCAGYIIETGANNLLCDFTADFAPWLELCRRRRRAVRRNLSPAFIKDAAPDEIYNKAREEIAAAGGFPGFILGTGVIQYGTPAENLLALRRACAEA
jgi:uroporphyrinogen decarboxylase